MAKKIVDPVIIAEDFHSTVYEENGKLLAWYLNDFYEWKESRWVKMSKKEIETKITKFMGSVKAYRNQAGKPASISAVINNLISVVNVAFGKIEPFDMADPDANFRYIALKTGLLDIEKALKGDPYALDPHCPTYFYTSCLDIEYDPDAKCELWLKFLDECFDGDEDIIAVIHEFLGLCLDQGLNIHKALLLIGEGANGKSVLLETFINLFGTDSTSTVPLEDFGRPHSLFQTLGKKINIAADLDKSGRVAEGAFKKFVARDSMTFERKFQDPITAKPTARLAMSANKAPSFSDRSNAIWRRLLVIMFENVLAEEKQDNRLAEKIKETDLSGIFNLSLQGLARLRKNGEFTKSAKMKEWLEDYKIESNPARVFLQEKYEAAPGSSVSIDYTYRHYEIYCKANGIKPMASAEFGKEVKREFDKIERKKVDVSINEKTKKRAWHHAGIKLKDDVQLIENDGKLMEKEDEF